MMLSGIASVLASYLVPQRFSTDPAELARWRASNSGIAAVVVALGLDHVYSTWWFVALVALFLAALVRATAHQVRAAARHTRSGVRMPDTACAPMTSDPASLASGLRRLGYMRVREDDAAARFVKHPWGYWGGVVLHAGMVTSVAATLVFVLTVQRGTVHLYEGESLRPGDPWGREEHGTLARPLLLPGMLRVDSIRPDYWPNDDLRQLTTGLTLAGPSAPRRASISVNRTADFDGVTIFQSQLFGHAFGVELRDASGNVTPVLMEVAAPRRRDIPSYADFDPQGIPYRLRAKYYASAARDSMTGEPSLTLRLTSGSRVIGQATLVRGHPVRIGPYQVTLRESAWWTEMVFARTPGVSVIFLGFGLMLLGALLVYATAPREVIIRQRGNGMELTWRAWRFPDFYREEYARIVALTSGGDR